MTGRLRRPTDEGGRGEPMVLTMMIDDATNRIDAGFFAGETVLAHMDLLGSRLKKHGRPVALYTDKDSIFRTWKSAGVEHEGPTQFARRS